CRQAQLVDAVQVRRVGDGDAQRAVVEGVRDRRAALEHVRRDLLGGVVVDAREAEVDEGELVACGEHARDAVARRDAFLDERRRERAGLLRAAAREREPVLRNELRRGEQVDDELDGLAYAVGRVERLRALARGGLGRAQGREALIV